VRTLTLPDRFIEQNKPATMYAEAGLDTRGIVTSVFAALGKDALGQDALGKDTRGSGAVRLA